MDKESISRLGLDYISGIDVESSDEIYNPTTTNHIIVLKLIKQSNICCPHCGLVGESKLRSTIVQTIKHASANENNIIIKLKRRVYLIHFWYQSSDKNQLFNS